MESILLLPPPQTENLSRSAEMEDVPTIDELSILSDEQLALWYHEMLQDQSSADSSMRFRLLREITARGITVAKLLEYTINSTHRVLH